jgi:RNA polymerase sigma factor (sigma-70 family)
VNPDRVAERIDILLQSKARFLQFLERRMGSRADAEDFLQTAFVRFMAREDSFRDEEKLIPWFYQLTRNLLVDHYRHRDSMARMEKTLVLEAEATTTGKDDELFKAICTCVHDVIPALKAEQAELVRRVELGGEPLHQVATDLGITPNNASVRLHRARRSLREGLQEMCGTCAEHGCLDCGCRRAALQ